MRLARVRRGPGDPIELAAGLADDRVALLGDLPADPVAVLADAGLTERARARAAEAADVLPAADLVFEPPVAHCSKICCLALNYAAHAEESKLAVPPEPVLFFKPSTALVGHGAAVRPPARTGHVEHEVELGVVIGRVTRDLDPADWRSAVAGYTVVNDMTARDLQLRNMERNQPWDQSKGFDTFAPAGPYLVTPDEIPDPHNLEMSLSVAGQVRQHANTGWMVYRIPQLLADLSDGMTLLPGDLIATGTTAGIAPLADGDEMRATIAGVGTLVNRIEWHR
jgi:5-oxopent-3-ene-1,2,5-tricarboxylate decarboxylase/2-hydroxyhepta-2,4-diene-1,7-dioate isomerase